MFFEIVSWNSMETGKLKLKTRVLLLTSRTFRRLFFASSAAVNIKYNKCFLPFQLIIIKNMDTINETFFLKYSFLSHISNLKDIFEKILLKIIF